MARAAGTARPCTSRPTGTATSRCTTARIPMAGPGNGRSPMPSTSGATRTWPTAAAAATAAARPAEPMTAAPTTITTRTTVPVVPGLRRCWARETAIRARDDPAASAGSTSGTEAHTPTRLATASRWTQGPRGWARASSSAGATARMAVSAPAGAGPSPAAR